MPQWKAVKKVLNRETIQDDRAMSIELVGISKPLMSFAMDKLSQV
jgi:hypothetical protein